MFKINNLTKTTILALFVLLAALLCSCTKEFPITRDRPENTFMPTFKPAEETEAPENEYEGNAISGIYQETVADVRVELYSDTLLRIEQKSNGNFLDAKTLAITNRTDWEGVYGARREDEDYIYLETANYIVKIPKTGEISGVTVEDKADGTVWQTNEADDAFTYLPDPGETPMIWAFSDSPRITYPENRLTAIINEENNGWKQEKNVKDYYVFVSSGDSLVLREDYNNLVGKCDMVTVKALGMWFSRYYAYSDEEILSLIDEYRERGYGLDYFVVDTDWKTGGSTGYDINTALFPDMEEFLAEAHEKNVKIAFNDHVRNSSENMLSEKQLAWFNEQLTKKLELGLDTWWYDRNWHYYLNSPFEVSGDLLGQIMYYEIEEAYYKKLNKRTELLSNYYTNYSSNISGVPYVGTHRNSIQWSGDIESGSADLQREIENMVMISAKTSTGYLSSDIGGHLEDPSPALFVRWTQYGMLSPIMRYHANHFDRNPWAYGDDADSIALKYNKLRYSLLPVFYHLAFENYENGLPLARRLDFYYEGEEAQTNDEYLLSEDILVAPISESVYDTNYYQYVVPADWFTSEITCKYYRGTSLKGDVVLENTAESIDFDWGTGNPGKKVPADEFSASFSATIKIGDQDVILGFIGDDGVRIYVDNVLYIDHWSSSDSQTIFADDDNVLKAGTEHELTVLYYEQSGGAKLQLKYKLTPDNAVFDGVTKDNLLCGNKKDSREVYLPEGEWINLFTGEWYQGPVTVEVSCDLEEYPVFVKNGSVIPLAKSGESAESSWEELTLDVFPDDGLYDSTTIYEDDGETLDYQSGAYRETEVEALSGNGKTCIKISCDDEFDSGFTTRKWTIRLHTNDKVTSVTVNGKKVKCKTVNYDSDAMILNLDGGVPDSNLVVFTFEADVVSETMIEIEREER